MSKKLQCILCSLICFSVLFLTIGYSAFQNTIAVEQIGAVVRIEADIRVTDFGLKTTSNGGRSITEDYDTHFIYGNIELPNPNSSVTYRVEVTNFGNLEMTIFDITGLPSNLEYDIGEYRLKEKICDVDGCILGVKNYFDITIKYKDGMYDSSNTSYVVNLDLDFRRFYKVRYSGINENNFVYELIEGTDLTAVFHNTGLYRMKVVNSDGISVNYNYSFDSVNPRMTVPDVDSDLSVSFGVVPFVSAIPNASFHGTSHTIHSDNGLSFDRIDGFNNLMLYMINKDYSESFTVGIDAYLGVHGQSVEGYSDVQTLIMSRSLQGNGFFIFLNGNSLNWDLGGYPYRHSILNFNNSGRYIVILTYSNDSSKLRRSVVINKSNCSVIYNESETYSLGKIKEGIVARGFEFQIGGDYYESAAGYPHQAYRDTKFYSYYINNDAMTVDDLKSLIADFGSSNVDI